jgi:hypothetical protein
MEMSRDKGRFLRAAASVFEPRGDRAARVVDAETVGNALLDHG